MKKKILKITLSIVLILILAVGIGLDIFSRGRQAVEDRLILFGRTS